MTTEEAIKIIDCYDIGFYDLSGEKIPADKLAEAFDMAIEALSERPKGEWIKKQVFNPELNKLGALQLLMACQNPTHHYDLFIECSVCGYNPYHGGSEPKFNYCSNCGADMRGDNNG